jgi:esterase/lipase superfamily enzyme
MDDRLHFGSSLVFVPRSHDVGSIGSSWLRRTFIKRDDDRLQLTLIKPLTRDGFQRAVGDTLGARRERRRALIFLHGFRVSFEEAALRAAQLACDLGVEGMTAFYSWASAGKLSAYAQDEETVRLTVDHFLEFLDALLAINSLEGVDIIAHSMGNRLLAAAVARLADARGRSPIGHIILAAPDISRSEFNKVATHYGTVASKRATLYSCAKDKALAVSTNLHNYLRIGYEPPVYCTAGIDTISASRLQLDLLGHGYIASVRPVIADLKSLLWEDQPPAQRNLVPVPEDGTAEYWLLRDG